MRYAQCLGLVIAMAFILGCGGSTTPSVYGPWLFTLTSAASPGTSFTGNTTLAAGGIGVTGTMTFTNNPCATSALLAGGISGPNVLFQITEGNQVVTLTGTINSADTAMSGSYTSTVGGCTNGDMGAWTASRG